MGRRGEMEEENDKTKRVQMNTMTTASPSLLHLSRGWGTELGDHWV